MKMVESNGSSSILHMDSEHVNSGGKTRKVSIQSSWVLVGMRRSGWSIFSDIVVDRGSRPEDSDLCLSRRAGIVFSISNYSMIDAK